MYRKEDNFYIRLQKRSSTLQAQEEWQPFLYFKCSEESFEEMSELARQNIFTRKETIFWQNFSAVKWISKKAVAVKNDVLLVEDSDQKLQPTKLENPSEIKRALKVHFPMISPDAIENAIHNWIQFESRLDKFFFN